MLARYTTTYADFKHAQRLHIFRKTLGRARYVFFVWILPFLGAIAAGLLLWDILIRHLQFPPWAGGVLAATAWAGLVIAAMRPFLFRRGYKHMKNGRSDSTPVEFEVSGDELISRIPGRSEGRFFRPAIDTSVEDEQMLLIYVSKQMFLMIPKRDLAETDLATLRTWLAAPPQPHSATAPLPS